MFQNYYKESSLICPMIFMKVFIIPPWISITLGLVSYIAMAFWQAQTNLSETQEHKDFISQKGISAA